VVAESSRSTATIVEEPVVSTPEVVVAATPVVVVVTPAPALTAYQRFLAARAAR
jgi:hypothetical protein